MELLQRVKQEIVKEDATILNDVLTNARRLRNSLLTSIAHTKTYTAFSDVTRVFDILGQNADYVEN